MFFFPDARGGSRVEHSAALTDREKFWGQINSNRIGITRDSTSNNDHGLEGVNDPMKSATVGGD